MKENIYGLIKLHPIKYKKGRKVKLKKLGTKRMSRRRTSIRMNRKKQEFFDAYANSLNRDCQLIREKQKK